MRQVLVIVQNVNTCKTFTALSEPNIFIVLSLARTTISRKISKQEKTKKISTCGSQLLFYNNAPELSLVWDIV